MGYLVHRYLFVWFLLWVLCLPFWLAFSSLALIFAGVGFLVVVGVRCRTTSRDAAKVFIFIFLPFVMILDMLFQACHWSCACGHCQLPMADLLELLAQACEGLAYAHRLMEDGKLADASLDEAFGGGTSTERLIRCVVLALGGEIPEGPMCDVLADRLGLKPRIIYQATAELRRKGRG